MNVSHAHKFVFLAVPRTGSRVTFRELKKFGCEGGEAHSRMTHRMAVPDGCEDYSVVATVRNPFTRWVSCWVWCKMWPLRSEEPYRTFVEWLLNNPDDFPGFVERAMERDYIKPISWHLDQAKAPNLELLRYESLQTDFDAWLGNHFSSEVIIGSSKKPPVVSIRHNPETLDWKNQFTSRARDMVLEHSAEDFRRFSYSTDISAD
jgi:hypothetical protein